MASVKIFGDKEINKHLNAIANLNLADSVSKATTFIHGQAKNNATFNKGYSKGRLKSSIHMQPTKKEGNKYIGKVYTNVYYAPFVEFGTGQRGTGSYPYASELDFGLTYRSDWAGMVAQPFMYPAAKSGRKYVKEVLKADIKEKLK